MHCSNVCLVSVLDEDRPARRVHKNSDGYHEKAELRIIRRQQMTEYKQSVYRKFVQIGWTVAALSFGVLFLLNVTAIMTETQRCEREPNKPSGLLWKRYSTPIENALAVLNGVCPDQVRYLRKHRVPLIVLEHEAFYKRFGNSRARTENRSAIYIDERYGGDAAHLAAALSHEEVHVEHGDRGTRAGQHGRLSHWVFEGEEDEAHLQGDMTLFRTAGLASWTASEYGDVVFRGWHWFLPLLWLFLFIQAIRLSVEGISRSARGAHFERVDGRASFEAL